jgi:hypothetical protein
MSCVFWILSKGLLQVSYPFISNANAKSPREKIESILMPFVDFVEPIPTETDPGTEEVKRNPDEPTGSTEMPATSKLKPQVLYGSYFLIDIFEEVDELFRIKKGTYEASDDMSGKILGCATGSTEINSQVEKAKEIFLRMYPDEEFLPKAPDMAEDMEENGYSEPTNEPQQEIGNIGEQEPLRAEELDEVRDENDIREPIPVPDEPENSDN